MKQFLKVLTLLLFSIPINYAQTALDVNGSNQYAITNLGMSTTNFTIEMNVFPKGGDAAFDRVFSTNSPDYFDIAVDAGGVVRLITAQLGITGWISVTNIPVGTYSHLAFVRQNNQIRVFRDGNQVNLLSCNMNSVNVGSFTLGTTMGIYNQNANVRVDNFRLWNTARPNPDIQSNILTCLTGSEPNLAVLYHFNEGTGTSTADLSPLFGTTNATFVNGATWAPGISCTAPCVNPTVPTVTSTASAICPSTSVTLNISGNLNGAAQWTVYSGSCGGSVVGTTTSNSITISAMPNVNYYVRGTGGCVTVPGSCSSISFVVSDADGDGANSCIDCNDFNATVYPGAPEICDGIDNNCDGQIDEGFIQDQPLYSSDYSAFCETNGTVILASSELDFVYYLRNDANDSIIGEGVVAQGGNVYLPTNLIDTTTTFNVLATQPTYALNFDGIDDYVQVPNHAMNNFTSAITIESWIYPTKNSGVQNVLSKSSSTQNNGYIFPRTDNGWNDIVGYLHIGGVWEVITAPYPSINEWHHTALTYNGSMIRMYIDGVEVSQKPATGAITSNMNALTFGNQTGYSEFYEGKVDNIKLWNVARTAAEIQASMTACYQTLPANLRAFYKFETGGATTAIDAVNGVNGTLTNMATWACWKASNINTLCNICTQELSQKLTITIDTLQTSLETITACDSYEWNGTIYTTSGLYSDTLTSVEGCVSIIQLDLTILNITPEPVTAGNTQLCTSNTGTTVNIPSSQIGVDYALYDAIADTMISGPVSGTGSAISFNTGVLSSNMTFKIIGEQQSNVAGSAIEFDGVDDYMEHTSNTWPLGSSPMVMEAWVYLNSYGSGSTILQLSEGYQYYIDSVGRIHWASDDGNWGGYLDEYVANSPAVPLHEWVNIAFAYSPSYMKEFYINGVFIGNSNTNSGFYTHNPPFEPMTIGGVQPNLPLGGTLDGKIGEIAIFNTNDYVEVLELDCIDPADPTLQFYLDLSEGTGTMIIDPINGNDTLVMQNMNSNTAWKGGYDCRTCRIEMANQISVSVGQLTSFTSVSACDFYDWNGTTYNATGLYTDTLTSVAGCDSIVELDLTIITITQEPVSAVSTQLCAGNTGTTINLPNSQIGVNYTLYDANTGAYISGPVAGNGSAISFATGPLTSTTTFKVIGENPSNAPGSTIQFDGIDDYLELSTDTLPNGIFPGVVEAWIFLNSYGNGGTILQLKEDQQYFIDSIGRLHWASNEGNWGGYFDQYNSTAIVPLNQWVNVAFAYSSSWMKEFYINGVFVGNDDMWGNFYPDNPPFNTMTVGGVQPGTPIGGTLDGRIEELALFGFNNTAEISDRSCIDPTNPNLLMFFDFNEGSGVIAVDPINGNDTLVMQNMNSAAAWQTGSTCGTCSSEMANQITVQVGQPTTSTTTVSECVSYLWNNTNYTASGTYTWMGTNAAGCDSTATLNLTILNPTTSTTTVSECVSYLWNNTNYTTSGTYTWMGTNAAGCDSTATLNLTILNPTTSTTTVSECVSYLWNNTNYTASGTYTWMGTNTAGCDSTATLNLTITSVDVSVTDNSPTLQANLGGALYQWIDCGNNNLPMIGETNQVFTAQTNGDYAVIITTNNCSDTSACYSIQNVGIKEVHTAYEVNVYPNPFGNEFHIELSGLINTTEILIYTAEGRLVAAFNTLEDETMTIDASTWESGVYFLSYDQGQTQQIIKVIKQ